jgi:hypothetical protein
VAYPYIQQTSASSARSANRNHGFIFDTINVSDCIRSTKIENIPLLRTRLIFYGLAGLDSPRAFSSSELGLRFLQLNTLYFSQPHSLTPYHVMSCRNPKACSAYIQDNKYFTGRWGKLRPIAIELHKFGSSVGMHTSVRICKGKVKKGS